MNFDDDRVVAVQRLILSLKEEACCGRNEIAFELQLVQLFFHRASVSVMNLVNLFSFARLIPPKVSQLHLYTF